MEAEVKRVSIADIDLIQVLSSRAFFESFSSYNTKENMDVYMESAFNRKQLMHELSNPDSQWYVYFFNGIAVGYLKVNVGSAQTEHFDSALEVERIYVLRDYQKQKIGQALMMKAFDLARGLGLTMIWLGVWEHNVKAIKFYQGFGFKPFTTHVFKLGTDLQTDILLKLEL